MPRSMTGFGCAQENMAAGRLICEMQSINRKHLEIVIQSPKEFTHLENTIRKWISSKIMRGQVSVRLYWDYSMSGIANLLPSEEMLLFAKKAWEKLCKKVEIPSSELSLQFLVESLPIVRKSHLIDEEELPLFEKCVNKALEALLDMKSKEGEVLIADIAERLQSLQKMQEDIAKCAPNASNRFRQKLLDKLSQVASGNDIDERVLKEVALFAEKVDIVEELTRLRSHFPQMQECFETKDVIGRKMEFILQEIAREINTIGAKSVEPEISLSVIEMKTEVERIREQIQNIE